MVILEIPDELLQPWMLQFMIEDDPCSECQNDRLIEALMQDFDTLKAALEDHRDEIRELRTRVKELEARPYIHINEPVTLPYRHLIIDPNTTDCPDPWWTHNQVTCKY